MVPDMIPDRAGRRDVIAIANESVREREGSFVSRQKCLFTLILREPERRALRYAQWLRGTHMGFIEHGESATQAEAIKGAEGWDQFDALHVDAARIAGHRSKRI